MAKKLTSKKAKEILHDKEVHGHPLTDKQRRFFGAIAGGAKPYISEDGSLLQKKKDNYGKQENYNYAGGYIPEGYIGASYTTKGFNYNGAWGGPSMQMGGSIQPPMAGANQTVSMAQMGSSIPGSVGFTYARTGSTPSEGPYAKKTMPSAEFGMSYYQHGLDWKPKTISKNGGWLSKYDDDGGVVKDDNGYWNPDNWGKVVEINSPNITMQGVNQPLIGISDEGDIQYMEPGKDYKFKGKRVKEYPVKSQNGSQQDKGQLKKLDDLTNFTNYNKPQAKFGWLEKYK